jgi:hypothetical protein
MKPSIIFVLVACNGGTGGDPNVLYFADDINGEPNGLFAAISVTVPEPSGVLPFGAASSFLLTGYGITQRRL